MFKFQPAVCRTVSATTGLLKLTIIIQTLMSTVNTLSLLHPTFGPKWPMDDWPILIVYLPCTLYLGGNSQDVKRLNKCYFYPPSFGFFDHLHLYCFDLKKNIFLSN